MNKDQAMNATRTQRIAGHKITLTTGRRYLASRPFATRGRRLYDVSIADITDSPNGPDAAAVTGLGYRAANRLLAAFNNGPTSFEGRVW